MAQKCKKLGLQEAAMSQQTRGLGAAGRIKAVRSPNESKPIGGGGSSA